MEEEKQVIFRVEEQLFGIHLYYVNSIEEDKNIVAVPNIPGYIEGILHLREQIIPIYNIRKRFQYQEKNKSESKDSKLIIVQLSDLVFGWKVDEVLEIKEIEPEMYKEVPAVIKKETEDYLAGILVVDKKLILLLNPEKLLTSAEKDQCKILLEEQDKGQGCIL